jgi:hypothetical protein
MHTLTGIDVRRDIDLALALAASRPSGPTVEALRARLKNYIEALADPAAEYAKGLADQRAREIAEATVRQSRKLARGTGGEVRDPAATLRLLAKSVDHLSRYAQSAPRLKASRGHHNPVENVRTPAGGGATT